MSISSKNITILGIETSCDETAAAIVTRTPDGGSDIRSNVVLSQLEDHAPFGGVVPEIAARAHISNLDQIIARAIKTASVGWDELDGIAATAGPGLIGGLLVGTMTARAIAHARNLPYIAINHLEGHALTPRLTSNIAFPYLTLLVSGGHTQLLIVTGVGKYHRLGTTIDDALGEAFDKIAKLLGLAYPGGPSVEKAALKGCAHAFDFPRPLKGRKDCHFSFSGLKTAVRYTARDASPLNDQTIADICASFQAAVCDCLCDRTKRAMDEFKARFPNVSTARLIVTGGVSANLAIREALNTLAQDQGFELYAPPLYLCGDNAAMIAWAGAERMAANMEKNEDITVHARWPLDPKAEPASGAGVKA